MCCGTPRWRRSVSVCAVIDGFVEQGFEPVRAAFEANFARRRELGAACAAYHRGRLVVDLWGGVRDAGRRAPWQRDTLVMVYSTSKGLAAMTLAVAHSRGWLDYDAPVAASWPDFAEEIAAPLGVEFYFGLPASVAPDRVASIEGGGVADALLHPRGMPAGMLAAFLRPSSLTARVFANPKLRSTAGLDAPEYRAVE